MKKITLSLIAIASGFWMAASYAGDMGKSPTENWTGIYVGGNVGGAWATSEWVYQNNNPYDALGPPFPLLTKGNSFSMSNFLGGAQLGFNYQLKQFLIGPEIAYTFAAIGKQNWNSAQVFLGRSETVTTNIGNYYTISGRIGALFDPSWLIYGKGGYVRTTIDTGGDTLPPISVFNLSWDTSVHHNGWTAGGGVEYKFMKRYILGLEYNYLSFNNAIHTGNVAGGIITPDHQVVHQVDANIQNVLLRVNVLLG